MKSAARIALVIIIAIIWFPLGVILALARNYK